MPLADLLFENVLLVTVEGHGRAIERRFPAGRALTVGPKHGFPARPDGAPIAVVDWTDRDRALVQVDGRKEVLERQRPLRADVDDWRVEMVVVRRFWLRPIEPIGMAASLAWFTIVFAATVGTGTTETAYELRCQWLPLVAPYVTLFAAEYDQECVPKQPDGSTIDSYTAEYLARLLKKDYAGADDGYVTIDTRPITQQQIDSYFIPAGNDGPITSAGGAKDTAPEAHKAPKADDVGADDAKNADSKTKMKQAKGPRKGPPPKDPGEDVADASGGAGADADAPTEEKQGWGIQDWYDARDKKEDEQEIAREQQRSRNKLKIDPDDPDALQTLGYYQYLQQDFDAAKTTYERFTQLYPDDPSGYNNLALVYKRTKDYKREEQLLRLAVALEPGDPTAQINLALNLAHQGKFDEANAIMRRLEITDPHDPYADLHRSKIAAAMGKDDEAYAYLDKACAGMQALDTLHMIEFRQDIRVDPAFDKIRTTERFHAIMVRYYGKNDPVAG